MHHESPKANEALSGDTIVSRLVLPYVQSIHWTGMFFQINQSWNKQLDHQGSSARIIWIDTVAGLTEYPEAKFIPNEIKARLSKIQDRADFVPEVRSLMCPWTNHSTWLIPRRSDNTKLDNLKIVWNTTLSDDDSQLVFRGIEINRNWAGIGMESAVELTCNSTPFHDTSTPVQKRSFDVDVTDYHLLQGYESLYDTQPYDQYPHLKDMCDYTGFQERYIVSRTFPVHGAVFAVMVFPRLNSRLGGVNSSSIYYFCKTDQRLLGHKTLPNRLNTTLLSRPGKLWLTSGSKIYFFGENPALRYLRAPVPDPRERMASAFYMVSHGAAERAINFMSRVLKLDINTPIFTNGRSLAHHAAACNQSDALAELLRERANPVLQDGSRMTPLELACFGYHHGCIAVLAHAKKDMPIAAWRHLWEAGWHRVCSPETLRTCLELGVADETVYYETLVPMTVEAMWSQNPVAYQTSHIMLALRSRTILCSRKAVEFLLTRKSYIVHRFSMEGGFKCMIGMTTNEIQEDAMLDTMCMAVTRLGVDINTTSGVTKENHVVWAVRMGSLKTVKVLVQKLGADVKSTSNTGHSLLKIALDRVVVSRNRDLDSHYILRFLTEEVEDVMRITIMRLNEQGWR